VGISVKCDFTIKNSLRHIYTHARSEVSRAVKIQNVVISVVTAPCSGVLWYQLFKGPCCLHRHGVRILPHGYTALQPIRPRLECTYIFTCHLLLL